MRSNTTPFLPPPAPPCPYISIRIIDLHVHISSQMEGSCIENGPSEQSIHPYRVLLTEKTIHSNTITEKKNKIVRGLGRKRKRESNNKKEKKKKPQGLRLRCEQREQKKREREKARTHPHEEIPLSSLSPLYSSHNSVLSLSISLSFYFSLFFHFYLFQFFSFSISLSHLSLLSLLFL